jgi:hypothetical protein
MLTTQSLESLVQRWHEAAASEQTKILIDKNQLYEDTEKLASYLADASNEKIAYAAGVLLKAFDKHNVGESTLLARWLGKHAFRKEPESKAFQSFHKLFCSIVKAKGIETESVEAVHISLIEGLAIDEIARQLGQGWRTITAQVEASTDERFSLYETTEQLAAYLETNQRANVDTSELKAALLRIFEAFSPVVSTQVANWVGTHTFKQGSKMTGAYPSFHHLCSILIAPSVGPSPTTPSRLSQIDSNALQQVREQKGDIIKDLAGVELGLLSMLPFNDLLAYKESNMENRIIVSKYLINQMNQSNNSYEYIINAIFFHDNKNDLKTLKNLIKFFGKENLPLFTRLELEQEFSAEGTVDNINENFKNLKTLKLLVQTTTPQKSPKLDEFKRLNIESLEEISIVDWCDNILPLDFLNQLPNLSILTLQGCVIEVSDLYHLQFCNKLRTLSLNCNFREDIDETKLKLPLQLEELSINNIIKYKNLKQVSLKIFENSKKIKKIYFSNIKLNNLEVFSTLNDLKILSLHYCMVMQQLKFLQKLPIEKFKLDKVIDDDGSVPLETSFLDDWPELKELELSYLNLKPIKNNMINKLKFSNSVVDFSCLQDLTNLNKITIIDCPVPLKGEFIKNLPISSLVLEYFDYFPTDFSCLDVVKDVEELYVNGCKNLFTFEFLKKMPKLKFLEFKRNGIIIDKKLAKKYCPSLEFINLSRI